MGLSTCVKANKSSTREDKTGKKRTPKLQHALPILIRPRRSSNLRSEEVDFLDDELLHTFDRVLLFKEKVEFLTRVEQSPVSLPLTR